jgi:endonuclease/exonuclease/phosphatase family metal-dependent hydrolase
MYPRHKVKVLTVLAAWVGIVASVGHAQETLKVIGYNVESGGSSPAVVKLRFEETDGIDLWGLCEVQNDAAAAVFETAAAVGEAGNPTFKRIVGSTGGADRLAIVYNETRLEKVAHEELHGVNVGGNHRSPLVARFRLRSTKQEFLFMVNHLARGNATLRHNQAKLLNQWAKTQQLPVVATGDYNFDFGVVDGDVHHDKGLDNIIENDVFRWVRPPTLVKTQDSNFNSVLDFVFVVGPAKSWLGSSEIIVKAGDFPDDADTSDHRPLLATFQIPAVGPVAPMAPPSAAVTRAMILQRITALEAELSKLKALVQQLPE